MLPRALRGGWPYASALLFAAGLIGFARAKTTMSDDHILLGSAPKIEVAWRRSYK
jgi:hypothetical protein